MTEKLTFNQKLLAVQKEVGTVKKTKQNPYFKSNYADINDILDLVKPILNKYGLVLVQPLIDTTIVNTDKAKIDIKTSIKTVILNADGEEYIEAIVTIPTSEDSQKNGSAITYYRRYAIQSLLALEAEDDDAGKATGRVVKPNLQEIKAGGYYASKQNEFNQRTQ